MIANVGTTDRALRLGVGALLILVALFSGWGLFAAAVVKYGAVVIGLILMATGAFRFCGLYTLLGVNTCRT